MDTWNYWICVDLHECLRIHRREHRFTYAYAKTYMDLHGDLRVHPYVQKVKWIYLDLRGFLWIFVVANVDLHGHNGLLKYVAYAINLYEFMWTYTDLQKLDGFTLNYEIYVDFHGFSRKWIYVCICQKLHGFRGCTSA